MFNSHIWNLSMLAVNVAVLIQFGFVGFLILCLIEFLVIVIYQNFMK